MPIDDAIEDLPENETQNIDINLNIQSYSKLERFDVLTDMKEKVDSVNKSISNNNNRFGYYSENVSELMPKINEFLEFEEVYTNLSQNLANLIHQLNEYMEILTNSTKNIESIIVEKSMYNHFPVPNGTHKWIKNEIESYVSTINKNTEKIKKKNTNNDWIERKLIRVNDAIDDIYNETDIIASKISADNLKHALDDIQGKLFNNTQYKEGILFINAIKRIYAFAQDKEEISYVIQRDRERYIIKNMKDLTPSSPKPEPTPKSESKKKRWWK
jgi:hypothetical protein